MRLTLLLLTFLLLFVSIGNTQDLITYDTLVFNLDKYGFTKYDIPIESSYDTLIGSWTDTMFIWCVVDSVPIDSGLALEFHFIQPMKNLWLAHMKFSDSGITTIQTRHRIDSTTCAIEAYLDTVVINKTQNCILVHVVPESAPAWIKDLTNSY